MECRLKIQISRWSSRQHSSYSTLTTILLIMGWFYYWRHTNIIWQALPPYTSNGYLPHMTECQITLVSDDKTVLSHFHTPTNRNTISQSHSVLYKIHLDFLSRNFSRSYPAWWIRTHTIKTCDNEDMVATLLHTDTGHWRHTRRATCACVVYVIVTSSLNHVTSPLNNAWRHHQESGAGLPASHPHGCCSQANHIIGFS